MRSRITPSRRRQCSACRSCHVFRLMPRLFHRSAAHGYRRTERRGARRARRRRSRVRRAVAAAAQPTAEAENVRSESQQIGDMSARSDPARPANMSGRVRCRDERLQHRLRAHDVAAARRAPFRRCRASSRQSPRVACAPDEIEVDARDRPAARRRAARRRGRASQPLSVSPAPTPAAEADLDDVGAGAAMATTARAVASASSAGSPMVALTGMWRGTRARIALHGGVRQRAQRAGGRVLRVNDVGGEMGAQQRFGLVRHAGKQPRRSARVSIVL